MNLILEMLVGLAVFLGPVATVGWGLRWLGPKFGGDWSWPAK